MAFEKRSRFQKGGFAKTAPASERLLAIKADMRRRRKEEVKKMREKRKSSKMLPFIPALSQSVVLGKTTMSFRYNVYPYYPRQGETFQARCDCSVLPGVYRCTARSKSTIRKVRDRHWRQIGVPSPADYEDIMRQVLGGDTLDLDKQGVLYTFERIG